MKNQILYLFDPLCGWCYGFSEVIVTFHEIFKDNYEFVAIPGGMVTGDRVGPALNMRDYILKSYPQVEQSTGRKFGEPYLETLLNSEVILDSEPPSRAVLTFRTFLPDQIIAYVHALQEAHYGLGRDYNDLKLYEDLAKDFGLDTAKFMERFADERMKQNVQEEFQWVKESGVQGYPTVVYRSESKYYMLAHGYTTAEVLTESLEKARKMVV